MLPEIISNFNKENLVKQNIYKSKDKYLAVYINPKLYEEFYNEKFSDKAFEKIQNDFSISLNNKGDVIGTAYVDMQTDPLNISLSGNLGSGRAFFYNKNFNIKGDKTVLATSKHENYSNGKFAISTAVKEAILTNILYDYNVSAFQTLAVLYTNEEYEFLDEYLDSDNTIKTAKFLLPCALEVRVYRNSDMYRISNCLLDNNELNINELFNNISNIEAFKFAHRFLHGSWSVGNLSVNGKMIDFDTSAFVNFRHPQYSNTNKYKPNYFGFEYEGQQKIINLYDSNLRLKNLYEIKSKEYFCNLLGVDGFNYDVDELFELFFKMSKMYSNNSGVFIYNDLNDYCATYNFSLFFQYFLILMKNNDSDIIYGLKLLINDTEKEDINCPKLTKDMSQLYFNEYILKDNGEILTLGIEFIKKYIDFIQKNNIKDIENIKFKQFIINENRYYLSGLYDLYNYISDIFMKNKNNIANIIINEIIDCNNRIYNENKTYKIKLRIYDEGLIYININKSYFNIKFVPFIDIDFAKCTFNNKEYFMTYKDNYFITKNINYDNLDIFYECSYSVLLNGHIVLQ